MLTKYLLLPTDRFLGAVFPPSRIRGKAPGLFWPEESRQARVGEPRLFWDGGEKRGLLGEETGLGKGLFKAGSGGLWEAEDCDADPPRRKPFPLNGMRFLMSCDPELAVVVLEGFVFTTGFFPSVLLSLLDSALAFFFP